MKKIFTIIFILFISNQLQSQSIIDSCFSSVPAGTSFASSALLANTTDADLLNWTGLQWNGQWPNCGLSTPPPCPGANQAGVFMGDQTVCTTGGEGVAFKLSSGLVAGQTYSFQFTSVSDGLGANGAFAPSVSINNIPDYPSAYTTGSLTPAGYTWLTSVFTFTAVAAQAGHTWLVVHSNDGSGIILNNCSAALGASLNLGNDTSLCSGNSFLINAGPNFTVYNWSTGATTQSISVTTSGTYQVFVVNSCGFGVDSIHVDFVPCSTPVVQLASSDTNFCVNECLDFFDLTSNSPTSWQWSFPGAQITSSMLQNPTGICYNNPGNYNVSLIACNGFGCDTITLTNFISVDAQPIISLGADTIICTGDSILLDGGAGFSSYLWSNNATTQTIYASTSGNYYVDISSGNCFASDTVTVTTQACQFTTAALASSDTSFCEKQCIDFFDLSTNNPTSWQWFFPGADSTLSTLQNPTNICYNNYGSYDVTLIACNSFGCDTLTFSGFINEYQNPTDSIWGFNDTLYSLSFPSYQWYEVTGGLIPGATNQYYAVTQPGSYYCIVHDTIGCVATSNIVTVTGLTPDPSPGGEGSIVITPNPGDGIFNVQSNSIIRRIIVYNTIAQKVFDAKYNSPENKIQFTIMANAGIYSAWIETVKGNYCVKFVVK